jgi:hypothetical protein
MRSRCGRRSSDWSGKACAGIAAAAVMFGATAALARLWQGIALRIVGLWMAAIAILVLALR